MFKFFGASIYRKIALAFVLLLLALGASQYFTVKSFWQRTNQEALQRMHWELAEEVSVLLRPYLVPEINYQRLRDELLMLNRLNPLVDIYILNHVGNIEAFLPSPIPVQVTRVDIEPVRKFIEPSLSRQLPLYSDDPRNPLIPTVFSAAPVVPGTDSGYVYLSLEGSRFRHFQSAMGEFYGIFRGALASAALVVFTALVGLLLFFLLTKRFYALSVIVHQFSLGRLDQRSGDKAEDEIGRLAREFNNVAETIQSTIFKLERTDKLRRELVANISHDLGSPLALASGYLETLLVKEQSIDTESRRRFIETALRNVNSLARLVEELLELSKLEAKDIVAKRRAFSILNLLREGILVEFQSQAGERNIELRGELPQALPDVFADISMIERVLCNLIENAINYTQQGGHVTVRLEERNSAVEVEISDSGIGIQPKDLPHVFDRYYRAQNAKLENIRGTGLGLAIVKKMLEAHDSKISVESTVGKGTRFAFQLPAANSTH